MSTRVINNAVQRGKATEDWCKSMCEKIDLYLAADRISAEEYQTLTAAMEKVKAGEV